MYNEERCEVAQMPCAPSQYGLSEATINPRFERDLKRDIHIALEEWLKFKELIYKLHPEATDTISCLIRSQV